MIEVAFRRPRPTPTRCALCHGEAPDVEVVLTCPGCRTLTHEGCRLEAGACPTLGCAQTARREGRRPRRRALAAGFVGWWTRNRVLVMANAVVWSLVGLIGGAFVLLFVALVLADA